MDLLGEMFWRYFCTCQGGKITEAERVSRESQWQVASQTRYLCVYLCVSGSCEWLLVVLCLKSLFRTSFQCPMATGMEQVFRLHYGV